MAENEKVTLLTIRYVNGKIGQHVFTGDPTDLLTDDSLNHEGVAEYSMITLQDHVMKSDLS